MDVSNFAQLVSTIGFPIAAYAGLFWYMQKQDKQHSDEISELRNTMEQNTLAIQKLTDSIKMGEGN